MDIQEKICSTGHGALSPIYLVVHSTADPGADAHTLWRYWSSGRTQYQVHYTCDWKGVCYHCMPDSAKAWHCGNGNGVSIGIEVCEVSDPGDFEDSWRYAVDSVATILKKHGWGVDRIKSHDWMSRNYGGSDHTDPIPYFNRYGRSWDEFVSDVREEMSGKKPDEKKEFKMAECIFYCEDAHEGYPYGARVWWNHETGFKFLGNKTSVGSTNFLKLCGLPVVGSKSSEPYLKEAYILTQPEAKKTYKDLTIYG